MIHYLHGRELNQFPKLKDSMFKDRKKQFIDRLGWDLTINDEGHEKDEYDRPDALYIICSDDAGNHRGSMRLLPSNTATMVKDHFCHVIPGIEFDTPKIWECTRFCSSPSAGVRVTTSVLTAAAKLMFEKNLRAFLAIFDESARRVYNRAGIPPLVLGSKGNGSEGIGVGLWQFDLRIYSNLVKASMYDERDYEEMYLRKPVKFSQVRNQVYEIA